MKHSIRMGGAWLVFTVHDFSRPLQLFFDGCEGANRLSPHKYSLYLMETALHMSGRVYNAAQDRPSILMLLQPLLILSFHLC